MYHSDGLEDLKRSLPRKAFSRVDYINSKKEKQKNASWFKKFVKTPKGYLIIILSILMIAGLVNNSPLKGILNVVLSILVAIVIDWSVGRFKKRKRIMLDGGIITGLIISLVLSTAVPWYQVMYTTIIAIASKHVLTSGNKPIFNPAAFGLLAAILLFSSEQSWWGGMSLLPVWLLPLIFVGGYLITKKVNKFPQVLSFLGVYFLLFILCTIFHLKVGGEVFRPPFINSTLFLAFFMLTDPPTSPAKYKEQIIFSTLAAIISVFMYVVVGGLAYLLIGLLLANGWKTLKSKKGKKTTERMASA
jgi:enediyne biosynthesis protein E5